MSTPYQTLLKSEVISKLTILEPFFFLTEIFEIEPFFYEKRRNL